MAAVRPLAGASRVLRLSRVHDGLRSCPYREAPSSPRCRRLAAPRRCPDGLTVVASSAGRVSLPASGCPPRRPPPPRAAGRRRSSTQVSEPLSPLQQMKPSWQSVARTHAPPRPAELGRRAARERTGRKDHPPPGRPPAARHAVHASRSQSYRDFRSVLGAQAARPTLRRYAHEGDQGIPFAHGLPLLDVDLLAPSRPRGPRRASPSSSTRGSRRSAPRRRPRPP